MNVFSKPQKKNKSIKYKTLAPWKKSKESSRKLGWGDQNVAYSNFGSYVDREIDGGVRLKLNILQILGGPVTALGIIVFFGGLFVQGTACPGKNGRSAHPVIANSFWFTVLTGLGIIIVGFLIIYLGSVIKEKRNEVFKRDIVRKCLERNFEISDYIYNSNFRSEGYAVTLLCHLNIRNNQWNRVEYNDYFVGRYNHLPFIFFDCKLINHEGYGKNSTDYVLFRGQVIVLKLNKPVDFGCQFILEDGDVQLKAYDSLLDDFDPLLNGERTLDNSVLSDAVNDRLKKLEDYRKHLESDLSALKNARESLDNFDADKWNAFIQAHTDCNGNIDINDETLTAEERDLVQKYEITRDAMLHLSQSGQSKSFIPFHTDANAMQNARQRLLSMYATLTEVVQNAQCEVGWILAGSYLVIILENAFDPFEFGFADLFRSCKKISNRVDKQVQWLCSVLEPHVRAGLI